MPTNSETPCATTPEPSATSTCTSPARASSGRPRTDQPDASISETLRAPAEGIGLVTRPGQRYAALTWNGRHVGTAHAVATGHYRVSPALSGARLMGGVVSTAQLVVLAERFAAGATGEDLTGRLDALPLPPLPERARTPLVQPSDLLAPVPAEPGPDCPACGSAAYLELRHDPTGQHEGWECQACGYGVDEDGRPL